MYLILILKQMCVCLINSDSVADSMEGNVEWHSISMHEDFQ
jgi:hypothetical protein